MRAPRALRSRFPGVSAATLSDAAPGARDWRVHMWTIAGERSDVPTLSGGVGA